LHINSRTLYLSFQNLNSLHTIYQSHLPLQFNIISPAHSKLLILSLFYRICLFPTLCFYTGSSLPLVVFFPILLLGAPLPVQNTDLSSGQQGNFALFNSSASPAAPYFIFSTLLTSFGKTQTCMGFCVCLSFYLISFC